MNPKSPETSASFATFIFETQFQCDYEIATDELCCQVGAVLSHLAQEAEIAPMQADLAALQRLIYNLNGSVRGRLGIFEEDLAWLKGRYDHYNEASRGRVTGFVLPQGPQPIPTLHLCRCGSKKVVRLLVRLEERGALRPHSLSVRQPAGQLLLRADRLPQAAVAGGRGALRQHQLLNTAKKLLFFMKIKHDHPICRSPGWFR